MPPRALGMPLLRSAPASPPQASSHSYRLLSLKANGKFDSVDSGDDAPLTVSTAALEPQAVQLGLADVHCCTHPSFNLFAVPTNAQQCRLFCTELDRALWGGGARAEAALQPEVSAEPASRLL